MVSIPSALETNGPVYEIGRGGALREGLASTMITHMCVSSTLARKRGRKRCVCKENTLSQGGNAERIGDTGWFCKRETCPFICSHQSAVKQSDMLSVTLDLAIRI